jgi:hypothetical protein
VSGTGEACAIIGVGIKAHRKESNRRYGASVFRHLDILGTPRQ